MSSGFHPSFKRRLPQILDNGDICDFNPISSRWFIVTDLGGTVRTEWFDSQQAALEWHATASGQVVR